MVEYNWIDWLIIIVIFISIFVSFIRGLITETIALGSWILGFWLAFENAASFVSYVPELPEEWMRLAAAFGLILIVVLMIGGVVNIIVNFFIRGSIVRWIDKILGIPFGFIRGYILIAAAILFFQLTPIVDQDWWQESAMIPSFQPTVEKLESYIPKEFLEQYFGSFETSTVENEDNDDTESMELESSDNAL